MDEIKMARLRVENKPRLYQDWASKDYLTTPQDVDRIETKAFLQGILCAVGFELVALASGYLVWRL